MFDEPGIDVDDVAWIERDQFVYFVEMERQLNDPADWPRFRSGLVEALAAAFGLSLDRDVAGAVLDGLRCAHDPVVDWDGFKAQLWGDRSALLACARASQ